MQISVLGSELSGSRITGIRGFSLFELLVVLVLMSLALAVVLPSFSRGLKGLELEATGRNLITRMKQARARAITEQRVFRILVSKEENSSEGESVNYYTFTDEFEVEIKRFVFPGGISSQVEDGKFPVKVSFYPNGRSSGASFLIENEQERQLGIFVDPITGLGRVMDGGGN